MAKKLKLAGKRNSVASLNAFKVSEVALSKAPPVQAEEAPERKAISIIQAKGNVYYILINEPDYSYVLKPNLCYTLKMIPYSSRRMQVDGYRCALRESVKASTCFGYISLVKFVKTDENVAPFDEDLELVKKELGEQYTNFLTFSELDLLLGESILLRVEIDRVAMSQYKVVLEYLLRSNTQSVAHQRIDHQRLIQSPIDFDSIIERDTAYSELNNRMDEIFDTIPMTASDVVLVCGAANCGKSSLVHHLINRYVSRAAEQSVLYLECDPGQTEFAPCGILSLVTINQQIISPPGFKFISNGRQSAGLLTESGRVVSKIYGTISPSDHGPKYIDVIKQLIEEAHRQMKQSGMPLFVNTMGWIEDLGLELLVKTINLTRPTQVIRIQSNKEDFFPSVGCIERLDSFNFKRQLPRDIRSLLELCKKIPFRLWYTSACVSDAFTVSPYRTSSLRREINQLAYVASSLWPDLSYLPFYAIRTVKVPLSGLFVHILNNQHLCPQSIYDLLNASWVMFGNIDEADVATIQASLPPKLEPELVTLIEATPPSAICLGCGVVRTIDIQGQCLNVLMPQALASRATPGTEPSVSAAINLIVLPDLISIPSGLLNEQFLYQGASSLPYIFSYFESK